MRRTAARGARDFRRAGGLPQRFAGNILLWLLPVTAIWLALTPTYNRFLLGNAENLLHLVEWPDVSDLLRIDDHYAYVSRRDFPQARALVGQFRVTDIHFHLILVAALFLAIPRIPWRERLDKLGVALRDHGFRRATPLDRSEGSLRRPPGRLEPRPLRSIRPERLGLGSAPNGSTL